MVINLLKSVLQPYRMCTHMACGFPSLRQYKFKLYKSIHCTHFIHNEEGNGQKPINVYLHPRGCNWFTNCMSSDYPLIIIIFIIIIVIFFINWQSFTANFLSSSQGTFQERFPQLTAYYTDFQQRLRYHVMTTMSWLMTIMSW